MNELIEKIKIQINAILDIKVGDTTVKGSLSQIDSRASAIPVSYTHLTLPTKVRV